MYAGGLSYFSSGSFLGTLRVGASWAEALASPDRKSKQVKKRVLDIIKHLQLKKGDRISEQTRCVHQIFQRKPATVALVNSQRPSGSQSNREFPCE
jgi:hypothetical protein